MNDLNDLSCICGLFQHDHKQVVLTFGRKFTDLSYYKLKCLGVNRTFFGNLFTMLLLLGSI